MASDNSNYVQPSIPLFDGHYDHWSMLMENFMRSKEYWSIIETGIVQPAAGEVLTTAQRKTQEEQQLKDLKAKNYLFQAIDRTILETILQKDTSKQIWDSMRKKYQGSAKVKRAQLQALRRDFETLSMKAGESVTDYFSRVMAIANKMRIHGDKLEDVTIIEKILRSMHTKFDYVVCSIEESHNIDEVSIDELQSSLLVHEQRINQGAATEEQALKVSTNNQSTESMSRGYGRGRGRFASSGRGRGQNNYLSSGEGSRFDKSKIECFNCHRYGHYRSECPNFYKGQGERSNYAEVEEETTLLMACHTKEEKTSNLWYLDSGCSNHMCGNKFLFSELDESFRDIVKFGDNSTVSVMGKGSVNVRMKNDVVERIPSVFYVPDLKSNLISLGQLQEKGYEITIKSGTCLIKDFERGVIARVQMTANRLFPIIIGDDGPNLQTCFSAKVKDTAWLWHFRYGHLNFNGLKTLQQRRMVTGLPQITPPSQVCEDCIIGKQQRDHFPRGKAWRAQQPLELVHSDICGPISPTSNGNKRYFISFIDDYSRKTWVYFLQTKSEAFTAFKNFKALIENEAGKAIKVLRTDRGGEFNSQEFSNFCETNGIRRQLTAAYTPQQNGVCERKNRTILNMVRSMLSNKCISKSFWPEAVNWSIHILNRSPTFAVKNMTPEEAWKGHKPAVDHFRIFGCIAFAHIPDEKRKKLDDKGEKCIFLGISEYSKAYKLYNPISKRIIISRDVVFDESSTWKYTIGSNENHILADLGEMDEEERSQQSPSSITTPVAYLQSPVTPTEAENDQSPDSRSQRTRRRPNWMQDYEVSGINQDNDPLVHFALFMGCDPVSFQEAVKQLKWHQAMDEEIKVIEKNNTWELTDLPKGQKSIGVKWVYKTKLNADGEVDKYKARLVVKGYKQEYGIDYKEVFAPVVRLDTIRLVISVAAQNSWPIYQLDVKSAFLHGELQEDVYVEQPLGYVKQGHEEKVYKLKKALYGLKQAPRAWYSRIESYFKREGFEKCPYEHTLFMKSGAAGKFLIVCLYVDDLIYTGNGEYLFKSFKHSMMAEFEMTDLGLLHYFLGIEVVQSAAGIFIMQKKYAMEILDRFEMKTCNSVGTPIEPGLKLTKDPKGKKVHNTLFKQIVGSLMYLTATRPDIMYAVSLISRYMENPTEVHLLAAKRIFRYLKGTADLGILYKKGANSSLIGFSDSDYAGDLDDRKSTSGFVFMMGSGAVSWSSKKQQIVTLSTTEAEFVAAASSSCQAIWLQRLLEVLHNQQQGPTLIHCDNVSAIKLSKNPVMHGKSKHIDVRYHFLRDLCKDGIIDLVFCKSEEQTADILTKPLKPAVFVKLRSQLGVCSRKDAVF